VSDLHIGILLAFVSAATFVGQNFWLRELQAREGFWRYLFIINVVPAAAGVLSWLFLSPNLSWPLVRGSLYASVPGLIGMTFLGLAVRYGDISHVGPVIGSKPLIVTALAAILALEPTSPQLWGASGLLLVALFLVSGNREVLRKPWQVAEPAVLLAVGFCIAYGTCDLITRHQMDAHGLGVWDFLVMNWLVRSVIVGAVVGARWAVKRERVWPRRTSTYLWNVPALTLHGIAFMGAIKFTDSAVLTNVLASVRGMLSIVAVLVLSHWGLVRKEPMTRPVIVARLIGSALICVAILLALWDKLMEM
jgi:drug/metabolite transporter (DMT)-like permease